MPKSWSKPFDLLSYDPARIPIEKLRSVQTIYTHDHCHDGMAAAVLLHDVLPSASIYFYQYGTDQHRLMEVRPNVLFCDLSPPAEKAQEFIDAGAIILDHHKSSKEVVKMFGENGIYADEKEEPGVSGAVLAYRHVWVQFRNDFRERGLDIADAFCAAEFSHLVGVRDTWQKSDASWREACWICEALRFLPMNEWLSQFRPFSEGAEGWWREKWKLGKLLWEKHEFMVRRASSGAYRFTTKAGLNVAVCSGVDLTSDVLEDLPEVGLAVGFAIFVEQQTPKMILSFRSKDKQFDCGSFCKARGGGGHTNSASFHLKFDVQELPNPYRVVEALVRGHGGEE